MKKLFIIACFFSISLVQAQDKQPTFEKANDLVKVTYYHANGEIKEQGFFKNKKLTGTWKQFDAQGNKTAIAHYENGKKVGKWFMWSEDSLKEINYSDNTIASVKTWKEEDSKVAIN